MARCDAFNLGGEIELARISESCSVQIFAPKCLKHLARRSGIFLNFVAAMFANSAKQFQKLKQVWSPVVIKTLIPVSSF